MKRNSLIFSMVLVATVASACSDAGTKILGRWESGTWTYDGKPAYVEFTSDGKVEYLSDFGFMKANWAILPENGELKITYPSGSTPPRCKFAVSGDTLTIQNPDCLAWKKIGEPVMLNKK